MPTDYTLTCCHDVVCARLRVTNLCGIWGCAMSSLPVGLLITVPTHVPTEQDYVTCIQGLLVAHDESPSDAVNVVVGAGVMLTTGYLPLWALTREPLDRTRPIAAMCPSAAADGQIAPPAFPHGSVFPELGDAPRLAPAADNTACDAVQVRFRKSHNACCCSTAPGEILP